MDIAGGCCRSGLAALSAAADSVASSDAVLSGGVFYALDFRTYTYLYSYRYL